MIQPRGVFCGLLLLSLCAGAARVSPADPPSSSPQAQNQPVRGMGEVLLAATAKTANLRRTSRFLDVDRIDKHLQVALLVDGTESMHQDLQSLKTNLRAFLESLAKVRRDPVPTVSVALVVYRDTRSPSGPVTAVIPRFETNIDAIDGALHDLAPESGAPYFREAIDQGLRFALTELDWRAAHEEGVSRWIIVAGDAPPYPEQTDFRRYGDQELIDLAAARGIAIYGMALGAGLVEEGAEHQRLRETAARERPDLRSFLARLARATGGHTLDVLDESSVRYWMTHRQQMPTITEEDIAARRQQRSAARPGPRIAVLPHRPLDHGPLPSGEPDEVATHLRTRLHRLGGVDVVPAAQVEQACTDADAELSLAELGRVLRADYLIWGSQKSNFDDLVIESGLYSGETGDRLAVVSESVRPISDQGRLMILNVIFRRLCEAGARELDMLGRTAHAQVLRAGWGDPRRAQQLMQPLARDPRAQSEILAGLEELERSLAFVQPTDQTAGDDPAQRHLERSITHLQQALAIDPHSPYAHLLLADCWHNLQRTPKDDQTHDARFLEHLQHAAVQADALLPEDDPVRLEITAQHALLVTKDVETAIAHYHRLAGITAGEEATGEDPHRPDSIDARFALRAHWMLAGIHLGEWDAISWGWDHVNPAQAREHILTILADWPDSPEAAFYRECLRNSSSDALQVPVGDGQLARTF